MEKTFYLCTFKSINYFFTFFRMVLHLPLYLILMLIFLASGLHGQTSPKWLQKAEKAGQQGKYELMAEFSINQIRQDSISGQTFYVHHYRAYQKLATAYEGMQRLSDAQTAFRNSVTAARSIPDISNTHIAGALIEQAEFFLRHAYYNQAAEIARHAFGTVDTLKIRSFPVMAETLSRGGVILWKSGSLSESENWLKRSLLIYQDTLKLNPRVAHASAIYLACVYVHRGKYAEADSVFSQYVPALMKHSNLNHPVVREAHFHQAKMWYETGRHHKALVKLNDMMGYLKIKEPNYVEASKMLVNIHICNARFKEGLALAEKVFHQYSDQSDLYPEFFIYAYADLLNTYHITGDSASAEKYFERASMITRKTFGASHVNYAWILGEKGLFLLRIGRFKDAITHLNKSATIYSEKSGGNSLPLGIALQRLGYANAFIGRHSKAQPYLLKALEIYKLHLDPDHPLYCSLMDQIAEMYIQVARYDEAQLYNAAFVEHTLHRMELSEPDHPEITYAYVQQARLFRMQERYQDAGNVLVSAQKSASKLTGYNLYYSAELLREEGELLKAMGKSKDALGKLEASGNVLRSMHFKGKYPNLFMKRNQVALGIIQTRIAQTYIESGKYYATQKYLDEALDLFKAYQGEDFVPYAEALSAMAELNFHKGNYTEGEIQSIRAKEIMAYVAGEFHPVYGQCLMTHAEILLALGRTEQAEQLMEEALEITRTRLGEQNKLYIQHLSDLGYFDYQNNNLKQAAMRLKEAIRLAQSANIQDKRIEALSHIRLSMVLSEQKMYRAAEKTLQSAFSILDTGSFHKRRLLGQAWFAYGLLCEQQLKWDASHAHFSKAYEINHSILNETHPDVFTTKLHLAISTWQQQDIHEANRMFRTSLEQIMEYIQKSFRGLSEQEKARIWSRLQPYFNIYGQFATENVKQMPEVTEQLLIDQLRTKSILLNGSVLMRSRLMNEGNEIVKQLYEKWSDLNGQLAFLSRMNTEEILLHGYSIEDIILEIELTEKSLALKNDWFQYITSNEPQDVAAYTQLLQEQDAAIEIVKLNAISQLQLPERYIGIILRKSQAPMLVEIGKGEDLEHKYLTNYRRSLQQQMPDPYSYSAYWKEFEPYLKGVQKIYLCAEGVFHLINPETFMSPEGKYLADSYNIFRISNLKEAFNQDPLTMSRKKGGNDKSGFIIGNPDMYLDMNTLSRTTPMEAYPNLPGTGVEVERVHNVLQQNKWKSTLITGASATEAILRSLQSPTVLHIASHAYFIEGDALPAGKNFLGMDGGFLTQHPMLRSGLLLSGSGSLLQGIRSHFKDNEDGLLSALEVMSLNLDQTELVVLSACESGLGSIVQGEGVMGLIRGFRIAGAKSVLMTLWKIPDESTGIFMNMFYLHWLSGKNRNDALKAAQSEFRRQYPHPRDWGAFVLNGI